MQERRAEEEDVVPRTFNMPRETDDFVREEAAKRGNSIAAMYRQIVYEWAIERIKRTEASK